MKCRYKKHIESCDRYDLYNFKDYIITYYDAGFIKRKYFDYIRKLIDKRFDVLRKIKEVK